ncbi:hypothetical protein GCM10027610_036030 [Dactylosporangium cerinum]
MGESKALQVHGGTIYITVSGQTNVQMQLEEGGQHEDVRIYVDDPAGFCAGRGVDRRRTGQGKTPW